MFSGVVLPEGLTLSLRYPIAVHSVPTEVRGSSRVYQQAELLASVLAAVGCPTPK